MADGTIAPHVRYLIRRGKDGAYFLPTISGSTMWVTEVQDAKLFPTVAAASTTSHSVPRGDGDIYIVPVGINAQANSTWMRA